MKPATGGGRGEGVAFHLRDSYCAEEDAEQEPKDNLQKYLDFFCKE